MSYQYGRGQSEFTEKVVHLNRVAKVVKGGRRFSFSALVELSGVKDMITKSLGTNNPVNTVRATIAALQALQTADSIAQARGKPTDEMERLSRRGNPGRGASRLTWRV